LSKQLSKPLEEPRVLKLASGEFSVNPAIRLGRVFTSRGAQQWSQLSHSAAPYRQATATRHFIIFMSTPAANQVLNNESQAILADQPSSRRQKSIAHESMSHPVIIKDSYDSTFDQTPLLWKRGKLWVIESFTPPLRRSPSVQSSGTRQTYPSGTIRLWF